MSSKLHLLLFTLLLAPFSAFCQEQGNCQSFFQTNPNLSEYFDHAQAKCWYGTPNADIIKVTKNYQVMINGQNVGIYGSGLNVFLGFGGADTISGRDHTDWIYGGPGHDTIYVTGSTFARGNEDADTFYTSEFYNVDGLQHIFDYNFRTGDMIFPLTVTTHNDI